ncbi:MAG: GGDEF domain-containing protein [Planctomycetota bacterium]
MTSEAKPTAVPRPVVVVGDIGLADRIERLLNEAAAAASMQSETAESKSGGVLRVPSFLSAIGEAARTEVAAVIGPSRGLSGMAASTAESLRKLAPDAKLLLLRSESSDEGEIKLALGAGFDRALPADPDRASIADALEVSVTPTLSADATSEPALRRADPHDLSTLDLGPASALPERRGPQAAAAAYQATLDAVLPKDIQDLAPPATPIVSPDRNASAPDNGGASLGDTDLVDLVLRGEGGMKEMALSMIRAQSGLPDINLYAPGESPEQKDASTIAVSYCDQTFGCLTCSDRDAGPQLAVWADWLVHWLRLEAQFNRLRDLAMKDELTGVWNRRYFNHFLAKILDHAAAGRQQVTLLVFDIDDFKRYNDSYGHAAGDEILRGVANLMKTSVREHDVVARIGGDEFAVIFWDAGQEPRHPHSKHPDDVLNAARRFQKAVVGHRFPRLLDKAAGTLTVSGGLAGFPWDGRTPEELLEAADNMAMQSKQQGKNAITFGPGATKESDRDSE